MAERGLDAANLQLLKTMTKRAGACLRNLQKAGHGLMPAGSGSI